MDKIAVVRQLTADVLDQVDPDEALLVIGYVPDLQQGAAARGPMGSGLEVGIALLLPFVFKFFDKLLESVAKRAGDALVDAIKKSLLQPDDASARQKVRAAVEQQLVALGIEPAKASVVATAVLATIEKKRAILDG